MVVENVRDIFLEAPVGRLQQSSFALLQQLALTGDFDAIRAFGQVLAAETGADFAASGFVQAKSLLELLRMSDVPAWIRIYCMGLVPRELVKYASECASLQSEVKAERNLQTLKRLIARGSPLQHELLKSFPLMLACRISAPDTVGLGDGRTLLHICDKVWSTCRVIPGNNATADLEVGADLITRVGLNCEELCAVLGHELGHIILDSGGKQQQLPDSAAPTAKTMKEFISTLPRFFEIAAQSINKPPEPDDRRKTRFPWGLTSLCTCSRVGGSSYFHISLMQDFGPIDFEPAVLWCYVIASTFTETPGSAALIYSRRGMVHLGFLQAQLRQPVRNRDAVELLAALGREASVWLEGLHASHRFSNSEEDMPGMLGVIARRGSFYGLNHSVAIPDVVLRTEREHSGAGDWKAAALSVEQQDAYMHAAIRCADVALARELCEHRTPLPASLSELGQSVCMLSDRTQNVYYGPGVEDVFEFVRLSHEFGVLPDAPIDTEGSTLLMQAAPRSFRMARLLLELGADVNSRRKDGETALTLAAAAGTVAAVEQLIAHGANVEARNRSGETALQSAVFADELAMADLLLRSGANPDTCDEHGRPPVMNAWSLPMIRLLHQYGADMDAGPPNGATALMQAAERSNLELLQTLLECGAQPDSYSDLGWTPLHHASEAFESSDGLRCIALLVERGAEINARTRDGITPLAVAAGQARYDVARWLLEHGAVVDAADRYGNTPLLRALVRGRYKHEEVVKLLIHNGADITHRNHQGQTAMDLASEEVKRILRQRAKNKTV